VKLSRRQPAQREEIVTIDATNTRVSRRGLLAGTAVLAAGTALPLGAVPALAKGPILQTQPNYFYRFPFGSGQVTVVSDGPLPLGNPGENFLGVPKEQITQMLNSAFLPTDNVVLEQNIPIVNFGDRLVLFDTGMGASKIFGPSTGRLMTSIKEAGIDPKDIDAVVCSHAHIDHIGGIVSADGANLFPNAQFYLSQADFDYWTDESKLSSPLKIFVEHARKNLMPVRDRLVFIKDGQEFLPGITAIAAPGHTVGHTIFMINSGGKQFCFLADLTHHPVLLLEKPRLEFAYDTDPKQSADTRVRLLDMLATNRIPVMAFHFPWPGFGHIAKAGEGFRYYPSPMELVRL
jgi:glyoxylase-like metal-dependent hydrolase (beta-lactamase superfamily II)